MASSVTRTSAGFLENCCAHAVRRRRNLADAHSHRVVDRIQNCRRSWNYRLLSNSLGAKRSNRRWLFDQNRFDLRHVSGRWNQVIMQILSLAGKEFFHQRHAEPLRDPAFNLSLDQRWIDCPPDIMSCCHLQHPDGSQFHIDLNLRHMRTEAINRIRLPLAVVVKRRDRRIERLLARDDVSVFIKWQYAQIECLTLPVLVNRNAILSKLNLSAFACARQVQNRLTQFCSRHVRRFASHECLSRSRSLPAVWADSCIP